MKKFWDIKFDVEELYESEDFITGLVKLGFVRKNEIIYVKDVINLFGDVVPDGLFVDLARKLIVYTPEPNNFVQSEITEDLETVQSFIRNNII